jgi:hypothetical protein
MVQTKEWKKDLGPLALIFLLVLLLYRDVAFFGKMFVSADTIAQGAVFLKFGFSQLGAGHYPLWFPHIFSGMPFFASMSFDVFVYPLRILLHYLDQFGLHFLNYKIVHFFVGGLFTYLLMRSYRLARSSAFVAAAVFIFSPMVASLEHGNRIITIMYIPAVFYLVKRLFERRDIASLAWAGLFIGFQMMANHLQIVYYTWLLMVLWFLYQVIADFSEKGGLRWALGGGAWIAGAAVIGLGVSALLLFSVYEYTPFSARASGDAQSAYAFATQWSLHPKEMLTFLMPSFMGFGGQTYWGYMPFTHCPNYLGVVALFLAVWALIFRRNRVTLFFALAGCLAVVISFGRYLPVLYKPMYWLLPFFDKFRVPAMILMVLFFCVAVLAGFGLQDLLETSTGAKEDRRSKHRKKTAKRLLVIAAVAIGIGVVLTLGRGPLSRSLASTYDAADAAMGRYEQLAPQVRSQIDQQRFSLAFGDLWKSLLLLASTLVIVSLYLNGRLKRTALMILVIALLLLDFFWVDLKVIRFDQPRGYEQTYYRARRDDVVRFLQDDPSLYRILPLDRLGTNEYAYFDISSVGGYHPAKLGLYQRAMERVGLGNPNLIDLLNVKYLISAKQIDHPRFEKVLETASGSVYRNTLALPRAFIVHRYEVIADEDQAFSRLAAEDFDPRMTAILEKQPSVSVEPPGEESVEVVRYSPREIALQTSATTSGLLVLSEIYYPAGWKARVDEQPAEILKADGLLRALYLPAGHHQVSLVFQPWTFRAGLWISSMFLLGLIITLSVTGLRFHTSRNKPSEKEVHR